MYRVFCMSSVRLSSNGEFDTKEHKYDAIVIGADGAGMRAGIELAKSGYKIAMLSKLFPTRSHTVAAQAGINAALSNMDEDSWRFHFFDTVKGSDWLGDQNAIHFMCRVARAMTLEVINVNGCGPLHHLQLHHIDPKIIRERLPGILATAKIFAKVYVTKEPVPVLPTVQYIMGGIPTNYKGRVITIDDEGCEQVCGLYSCGENSCASVHGANRLGANSLLDLLAFGRACPQDIVANSSPGDTPPDASDSATEKSMENFKTVRFANGKNPTSLLRYKLQRNMTTHAAVFREGKLLKKGKDIVIDLCKRFKDVKVTDRTLVWNTDLMGTLELQNMLANALHITTAMENRKESCGSHAREDFQTRIDEFDYSKTTDGQIVKSLKEHWRKNTMTFAEGDEDNASVKYRQVIDTTLDDSVDPIPPAPRTY